MMDVLGGERRGGEPGGKHVRWMLGGPNEFHKGYACTLYGQYMEIQEKNNRKPQRKKIKRSSYRSRLCQTSSTGVKN